MNFTLTSSGFVNNGEIPKKYTGEGEDISPPLHWQGVPDRTEELALICDDPDAPAPEPWVHWLMYRMNPRIQDIPENIPPEKSLDLPIQAAQGKNSWHKTGYGGPMPPVGHGWHRYIFNLYALDSPLDLPPNANKDELLKAMDGKILAKATLTGRYLRY